MQELYNLIYVDGDIIQTFVHLFLVIFSFDFLLSFAGAIKSIKGSLS